MTTTIIFGNGLGRSFDNGFFDLSAGIKRVWDSEDAIFDAGTKAAIVACVKADTGEDIEFPQSEAQLATLHRVVNACSFIGSVQEVGSPWLTDLGMEFPQKVNAFIGRVATGFRYDRSNLPQNYRTFFDNLCEFLRTNEAHIATLNYDNLLYEPLIDAGLIQPRFESTFFVDGFTGQGELEFDEENLERRYGNKFGWYLHLHGTPLFIKKNGKYLKLTTTSLTTAYGVDDVGQLPNPQVVLHHMNQKPEVIAHSDLLSTYWRFFSRALEESERVILVGYGGGDSHLNEQVSSWLKMRTRFGIQCELIVLCRGRADQAPELKRTWGETFRLTGDELRPVNVLSKDNILDFTWDWREMKIDNP